jgi:hypothetical protein
MQDFPGQRHDDLFPTAKPGETDSEARRACRSILSSSSLKSQCDLDDPILAKDREAKGAPPLPSPLRAPHRENLCRGCGKAISDGGTNCASCAVGEATKNMLDAARIGRQTANGPEAQLKRANTQRQNALAQHAWKPSDLPAWLTAKLYSEEIQPLLPSMSVSAIARTISVSRWYAGRIREAYRPHPRHWEPLAELISRATQKLH